MKSIRLWAGHMASKASLEAYFDQGKYLKAWAKYDHEPSTGNTEEGAEPSSLLHACRVCI